jgi:hypothetical protein
MDDLPNDLEPLDLEQFTMTQRLEIRERLSEATETIREVRRTLSKLARSGGVKSFALSAYEAILDLLSAVLRDPLGMPLGHPHTAQDHVRWDGRRLALADSFFELVDDLAISLVSEREATRAADHGIGKPEDVLVDELLRLLELALHVASVGLLIAELERGSEEELHRAYMALLQARDTLALWHDSTTSAAAAREAAHDARESAGKASESSLAAEFEALRKRQENIAWWFRGGAIALYAVTIIGASVVAYALHDDDPLSRSALQRLAPGIATLLLALFLGQQAKEHLRVAGWAAVLVAQLKSIRAYTGELDSQDAAQLRAAFGQRVFLESPGLAGGQTDPGTDVVALVREVAAATGAKGAT